MLTQNRSSFVGTMKGVPEEEEEEEEWSSLTTPPPKLPPTLVRGGGGEEEEEEWGIPEPPDGGWGWAIVAASFLCNVVVDGITYSFGIFNSHFTEHYHTSKGKAAWVGSLLSGCYLLAGPVVSALTNKFGCRPVTIAGSIISCVAFLLSTVAPSIEILMLTYGIMAGIGFGLIYLPAIVSVGYYFSTRRAFATGLAVCGSGMGAFVFAPLTEALLHVFSWQGALLVLAGLALNCCVFGALMRPLEPTSPPDQQRQQQPKSLSEAEKADSGLVLVADDQALLINTEPGVQSNLHLDQMSRQNSLLPIAVENLRNSIDMVPAPSSHNIAPNDSKPPRTPIMSLKDLQQRRFTMPATLPLGGGGQVQARKQSRRPSNRSKDLARPLYRKDIFYSGSIVHLPQYRQSKADIRCYIESVTTIPQLSDDDEEGGNQEGRKCCGVRLPRSMVDALREALDFSLLRRPAFQLACAANVLGMMGFYVPFFYITDSSVEKGVSREAAAFLLSILGITNLLGRLVFGVVVDRTSVRALTVNNLCLWVSGVAVASLPFCNSYPSIVTACTLFSLFVSAYISLTSIILVEMVGLDRLTNSFGLLSLFRGASTILGSPLAGFMYDCTGSYDIPFYVAGSLLVLSGVCTAFIPLLGRTRPDVEIRVSDGSDSGRPDSEPTTAL